MSGELRNSTTASMGRSGLGGGGAKSTTDLAAESFFRWGHRGARSLEAGTKYGTAATPSPCPAAGGGGGDEGDAGAGGEGGGRREARRSLASRRRARAPGRRKRRWSPLAAAADGERGLRVAAMWAPDVGERWVGGRKWIGFGCVCCCGGGESGGI